MKSTSHWPRHFYLIAKGISKPEKSHGVTTAHMGNKAYNLLQMASIGLRVPPALVIGTDYTRHPEDCLLPLCSVGLPALESATGLHYGNPKKPLIVSVRSGAPVSMPGMMETLLNVGLCDATLPGLLRLTGNPRMIWDAYRRLIATHAEVVEGADGAVFEAAIDEVRQGRDERELDFSELRDLSRRFLLIYEQAVGRPFPQDVKQQLISSVSAVFRSWDQPKARTYRELNHLDETLGTAVTIQQMVFGNTGSHSGAGVGFTRNPMDGSPSLWVDYLSNAQGEDVVAGQRNAQGHEDLAATLPQVWHELVDAAKALEHHFQDMQDFEFTVQDGTLYLLQARAGKRTPLATTRIALDLHLEGLIDRSTALKRTQDIDLAMLASEHLVNEDGEPYTEPPLAVAASACQGIVSGEVALDEARARERRAQGANIILVRQDAQTSDIAALDVAAGLLTQRGARTSHAAVVARQLGKVCLVGCTGLQIQMDQRTLRIGNTTFKEGETLTLDGNEGRVFGSAVSSRAEPDQELVRRLLELRSTEKGRKDDNGASGATTDQCSLHHPARITAHLHTATHAAAKAEQDNDKPREHA